MLSDRFSNATFVVTGGTGSFGSNMVRHLISNYPNLNEIRVFSRDENKQDVMRRDLNSEKIKYYIGDIRDSNSVSDVISGSNFVFHAAALKQVPSCEFFPDQASETNIFGSRNLVDMCLKHGVESLVCLSTDKAVYPINAMGLSKAMMEKIAQAPSRKNLANNTRISITRYGNVMMSRGSVIPLFIDQIIKHKEVTITDPKMTRFLMSLSESVDLVLHAFTNAQPGDIFVRKSPACSVETLVNALGILLGVKDISKKIIGIRQGEKIFESLLTSEEIARSSESTNHFQVPMDNQTLNYKSYFEEGSNFPSGQTHSYTSDSTIQLDSTEVAKLIENLPEFKKHMEKIS